MTDAQHGTLPTDATSQPAATMPDGYHPFAEEIARLGGQQPAQGASAPDAERVPEATQQPSAPTEPTETPTPETPEDIRAAYAELQRRLEDQERERQTERERFETQQKQWMEQQQQLNEQRAAELRKQAEQDYKTRLKAAYDKAVSADDDETGQQILDEFIRQDIAAQLASHFQQQIETERQQYEQNLQQFQQQAQEQIVAHYKPGFAQKLVGDYKLPQSAVDYLMNAPVEQMEQKAVEMQQLLAQAAPQIQQKVVEQQADARRQSGVHAVGPATGGPLPPRELRPMAADSSEAIEIARALLGS